MSRGRTLSQRYRHFAETGAAASPLYERVSIAFSESSAALRAIEAAPARKRQPALILAALHDLALAGHAPALSEAYANADSEAAAAAAIATLLHMGDSVAAIAARRRIQTIAFEHCAVLYPAITAAAQWAGADSIGLIDAGCSAGVNLTADLAEITYSDGLSLGDPASPLKVRSSIKGAHPVPERSAPAVTVRIGIAPDPIDVNDADDARWLRACIPPDQPEQAAQLEAMRTIAAAAHAEHLQGDPVNVLARAFAHVPAGALPVVLTTWSLSQLPHESRLRFVHRLRDAARTRPVAWVSAEGVGVAPTVPTLGDRRASGHSIIGVAIAENSDFSAEAVGRCWSRGRIVEWLAGP